MKKKNKIILWLVLTAVLCGIGWKFLTGGNSEPVYQAKRLTEWIDQYQETMFAKAGSPDLGKLAEAKEAIRQIGTNGLPTLVGMAGANDSKVRTILIDLHGRQRLVDLELRPAEYHRTRATYGFATLGPAAHPAVPELIALLSDPDEDVRASAAQCLSLVGPEASEAVPALVQLLNETGNGWGPIINNSMLALGCIHAEPETVIPLLLEYVNGSRKDWNYDIPAIHAIGLFGKEAMSALPDLVPLLTDPEMDRGHAALGAIWRIDRAEAFRLEMEQSKHERDTQAID